MPALTIRRDRTPAMLRKLSKMEEDARVARRMLAIANALDGMDRKAAAQAAGMDRQALRDWVIRYNAQGIDGLRDRWGSGRPPRLSLRAGGALRRRDGGSRPGEGRDLRLHARGPCADLRAAIR